MSVSSNILQSVVPAAGSGIEISDIGHLAVAVTDLAAARTFYCDLLGFAEERDTSLPNCGAHIVLRAASGQRVALCHRSDWVALPDAGVHNGYRVTQAGRDVIAERLKRAGIAIDTYHEVRAAEQDDNFYFRDPSGNRIQLVVASDNAHAADPSSPTTLIRAIDHAVVQAVDIEWEEKFYIGQLGLAAVDVVGWRTQDYVLARLWGEGKEQLAPGTMRWDKRFFTYPGQTPNVARPNVQLYVRAGQGILGVYLADQYFQAPPEELVVGTPRIGLGVSSPADLDRIAERLRRDGKPVLGPVVHPNSSPWSRSLYCKDAGANFLEFCCR